MAIAGRDRGGRRQQAAGDDRVGRHQHVGEEIDHEVERIAGPARQQRRRRRGSARTCRRCRRRTGRRRARTNISVQSSARPRQAAPAAPRPRPSAVNTCTAKRAGAARDAGGALTHGRGLASPLAAPVDPAQLGRAAGEVPVAAEGAHARGLGARNRDLRRDPVFRCCGSRRSRPAACRGSASPARR